MRSALLVLLILFSSLLFSRDNSPKDSLLKVLQGATDTNRIIILNKLSAIYWGIDPLMTMKYAGEALELSRIMNFPKGIISSYNSLAVAQTIIGNYPQALSYYHLMIKAAEKEGNKSRIATGYSNIGTAYYNMGKYDQAYYYFNLSYKLKLEVGDRKTIGSNLNNMGLIMHEKGRYEIEMDHYKKALKTLNEFPDYYLETDIYHNIARSYNVQRKFKPALEFYYKGLHLADSVGELEGMVYIYSGLSETYRNMKNYEMALEASKKGIEIAKQVGQRKLLAILYEGLSEIYSHSNDYRNAFTYHRLFSSVSDSLLNEESSRQITEMETKYQSDKKEKEIALLNKEKQVQHLELNKNRVLTYSFAGGFALVLILSTVVFNSYKQKQKANFLLSIQNREILQQKLLIEEKNKDITDSIRYASRIQGAILPPDHLIKQLLPDSFILYKPKDIVSGDFYWVEKVTAASSSIQQKSPETKMPTTTADCQFILFAAVDCTGHGVPGAFMSIVGHNGLTRSVNEQKLTRPSEILDYLNRTVNETLRQSYDDSPIRDGMDIALCSINLSSTDNEAVPVTLQYAGAHNPLLLVRNNQVIEINSDRHPVGAYVGEGLKPFTNHEIALQKGDTLYVFTDGYADQFGGEKGKKFKYAKLKELLLSIRNLDMQEQKKIMDETFEAWKGSLEQVDDVCVIGVRV